MNKIFLLAHETHRFGGDFSYAGTHLRNPPCDACDMNLNELKPPLLYYWDKEFGTPDLSISQGHDCFWGDLCLIVNERGKHILQDLGLPLDFGDTKHVKTKVVRRELLIEYLPPPEMTLYWAWATNAADADPLLSGNEVCCECGQFTKHLRQLTRLKIPASDATSQGVFSVRQNGGGPIFVTEEIRDVLKGSGLKGIGFYPAGRIVSEASESPQKMPSLSREPKRPILPPDPRPDDIANLAKIPVELPHVPLQDIAAPESFVPDVIEYLRLEEYQPDGEFRFLRTADVAGSLYYIWQFESDGSNCYATVRLCDDASYVGCHENEWDLTPEQYIMADYRDCI